METTIGAGATTLLRHPDFARFCLARFMSGIAMQMQNVAVGWLIYDLTHSAMALGMAGLAAFLPAIGLALFTGHVADRFDRRLILATTYAANSIAAAGLFAAALGRLGGPAPLWLIYSLIVIAGTARAFGNPASQALMPNLIPRALFSRGVAVASSVWQTSTILGPALGGFLYAIGPGAVFGTACALFAGASLCAATIRHRAEPGERRAVTWTSLVAGLSFIRGNPVILGATTLDLFAVLLGGATALLPIYAQTILHVGPWGLGLLRSMPGLGAVAMAAFLATRPLARKAGPRMFLAVGVFGLATIAFGLSTNLIVSMACLFVLGASDTISVVVRQTLVQAETPDAMRGRVAAVNAVFIGASNELGEFESGLLAAWLGAMPAVVLGGVGTMLVALAWSRMFPALRHRDRLVD
jgi:MFS family permease